LFGGALISEITFSIAKANAATAPNAKKAITGASMNMLKIDAAKKKTKGA
jgi:hypothetical protein